MNKPIIACEYRLYLFMRTSMASMTPGRVAAQACHAGNRFTANFNYKIDDYYAFPSEYDKDNVALFESYISWRSSTPQDFGTTIVLDDLRFVKEIGNGEFFWTDDYKPMQKNIKEVFQHPFFFETIIDPSYAVRDGLTTHDVENVETCSYLFCAKEDWEDNLNGRIIPYYRRFKLL